MMPKIKNFKRLSNILLRFICSGRWCVFRKKVLCLSCLSVVILIFTALYLFIINYTKCSFLEVEKAVFAIVSI